jgi:hypothetical protein
LILLIKNLDTPFWYVQEVLSKITNACENDSCTGLTNML